MIIPGVAGAISERAESPPGADIKQRLQTVFGASVPAHLTGPGFAAAASRGQVLRDGDLYCAVDGNIDWLQVEFADIQLKRSPAHAVLQAYRQHGRAVLSALGGRFAVCVWDAKNRTGLVACDRFGQIPVYWSQTAQDGLVFGPTATSVNTLLSGRAELSPQGIFNYLYFHMVPGPGTVFTGVSKLIAAHALIIEHGRARTERYWHPEFRENADTSMPDAGEEMLGLLASSVSRLAEGADTGAFLSGGLDSSTVAGLLARHQRRPKTYSIGFDAEGYDEIEYARLASRRFDTDFRSYYVTPEDVLVELPRIAGAYDEPFGNSSALPAFFCARFAASDGRQRLLAGDGGDELFAGNERYAKQTVFERYSLAPAWLRRHLAEPLLTHGLLDRLPLIGKVRSYIQQADVPLPDRLQTYNFLNRLGARQIVTDDLWQAVDPEQPLQLDRQLYGEPRDASRLNRMLYLDWHHTLADNDLRKVNRMCQLAGIEVEYPMLDDRLVEFSTRVSSSRKMRANRLRDFYKRAVSDFLPGEIIDKPKHGFGLPFGVWMEQHPGLQQLAEDNLLRMKRRHFVRSDFLDEITRLHREQHAGYYGEFIWVLMMLELWLTEHGYEP